MTVPEAELADILRRLAALEAAAGAHAGSQSEAAPISEGASIPEAGTFWALEGLSRRHPGSVMLVGEVTVPSGAPVQWQETRSAADVFDTDWTAMADSLAALAHPVRLRILRSVLDGVETAKELSEIDAMGSTGQVYHHLRHLTSTGWLRSNGSHHQVPAERVVPLLGILIGAQR